MAGPFSRTPTFQLAADLLIMEPAIFGMMVPIELDDSHYADIKMITRVLADDGLRSRLRSMNSSSDLYDALLNGPAPVAPGPVPVAQGS